MRLLDFVMVNTVYERATEGFSSIHSESVYDKLQDQVFAAHCPVHQGTSLEIIEQMCLVRTAKDSRSATQAIGRMMTLGCAVASANRMAFDRIMYDANGIHLAATPIDQVISRDDANLSIAGEIARAAKIVPRRERAMATVDALICAMISSVDFVEMKYDIEIGMFELYESAANELISSRAGQPDRPARTRELDVAIPMTDEDVRLGVTGHRICPQCRSAMSYRGDIDLWTCSNGHTHNTEDLVRLNTEDLVRLGAATAAVDPVSRAPRTRPVPRPRKK